MAKVWDQLTTGERVQSAKGRDLPTTGRAVQIVDFKSNKRAVLNEREISRIIKQEDLPTVVVSIGGVARSGKSFLLNLLVNFLSYLEKNETVTGWETSNDPVQGVNWAQSRKAVTLGIWIWSKQFILRRQDGKRVAVLLVDSQGTGDNRRSDPKLDTLIMYISLQLSSFQLINIVNYLTANELTSLQLCTDYADINKGSTTRPQAMYSHLFNNLVFVVRNCQDTDRFGEEPRLFQDIKEECVNAELSRAVEGIEKAFKHVTAFAFPYPGRDIAGASEKQKIWTLQDIPKEFLDPVKELAAVMFMSDRISAEELPTGSQIIEKFKVLKMRLESTDLPEIGNPADALQETILYQAYSKAHILYTETIKEVQRHLLSHKSEADLRNTLASARDLALQVFYTEGHQHKYGHSIIWSKYEDLFMTNCDKHQNVLIMKYNQDKKIADLERHNQEVKRQMDDQARESARQLGKLESESKETKVRLEETKRNSEKREQAHQTQLDKITEQMKTGREEDRAFYERESERYKESIDQEKESRSRAERMHGDRMSELNSTIERLNNNFKEKEMETNSRIQQLQRELEKERNRPAPSPPKRSGCSIM